MSKKLKIWLAIIAVFLILVGWLVYTQWDNINAFIDAFRYSNEEVETKLQENNQAITEYLEKEENITVREMTEDEVKALAEGTLTEEELIKLMTGQTAVAPSAEAPHTDSPKKPAVSDKPVAPNQPSVPEPPKTTAQTVAEAVAKLYITKNDYLGRLDAIEAKVRAEYIAMSNEEKKDAKKRMLSQYLPMVSSWENECDAAVYGVIGEIRKALKASGQTETVADQIEAAYLNEKRLKKSYFIGRYMD